MKKILFIHLLLSSICIISCSSNSTNNLEQEYYSDDDYENSTVTISAPDENESFLGDFDPIQLQDLMFLQKSNETVKAKEIKKIYLVPRANTVELCFRDGANEITISWNKTEREKILSACETFLQQYENRTVPHQKVNNKTAYVKLRGTIWFGVVSSNISCKKTDYYVNCEFIDKKPYLIIKYVPSRTDRGDSFTPSFALYMSPTQIREFQEVLNQENLNELVKTLNDKAYTY